MTKIIIFKNDKYISGFQVKGHSGYAESGSDIVCSAISTACQMAIVQLNEVLNLDAEILQNDGFLAAHLGTDCLKLAQPTLQSLQLVLEDIAKNYSKFVKLEVKKDVY